MPNSTRESVVTLASIIVFTALIGAFYTGHLPFFSNDSKEQHSGGKVVKVHEAQADEPQNNSFPVTVITPVREVGSASLSEQVVTDEQEQIDAYIRTIFGKDAKVAIAVNRVECNPANKQYPKCVYHTDHEYSVGIFQINLFNKTHAIHAAKVPGKTMEEKIESLKNPYINTLVAYKIFTSSGFAPWSGYSSGRYLDHMGE